MGHFGGIRSIIGCAITQGVDIIGRKQIHSIQTEVARTITAHGCIKTAQHHGKRIGSTYRQSIKGHCIDCAIPVKLCAVPHATGSVGTFAKLLFPHAISAQGGITGLGPCSRRSCLVLVGPCSAGNKADTGQVAIFVPQLDRVIFGDRRNGVIPADGTTRPESNQNGGRRC